MGVQSIKIPIDLELRNFQGAINTLQNALNKIKPGTTLYKSLEKDLQKIAQRMNSLEVASQQTFSNSSDVQKFQKQFNDLGINIQETANKLKSLSFDDLGDIFSEKDLANLKKAQGEINSLQNSLNNLKTNKMKELMSDSEELSTILKDLGVGDNLEQSLKEVSSKINKITSSITTKKAAATKNQNKIEKEEKNLKDLNANAAVKEIQEGIYFKSNGTFKSGGRDALKARLTELGYDKDTLALVEKMAANNYQELIANLKNNENKQKAKDKLTLSISRNKESLSGQEKEIASLEEQRNSYKKAKESLTGIDFDPSVIQNTEALKAKIESLEDEIGKLKQGLVDTSGIMGDAGKATEDVGRSMDGSSKKIEQAKQSFAEAAEAAQKFESIKSAVKQWFGFNEVINMTKNAVRNIVKHFVELDDVMTQIAIVTRMSQQDLWGQMSTYSNIANQYGVSIKGVYEVSQLYYQQGLQTADVMQLTTETLKMAKIANLDYALATDYMTVALRGFKMEMSDAQTVTDVYSALAAGTASNTKEIAVAMSKTASSAEAVGSSFESTSAMIATMIATTREAPENIGSAMKSIISRYGEMTSDPTKLVDSEGEEMSLNRVDKALRSVGITLQDANGQFRDFDDVIVELAQKWDTIDVNAQRYIATIMAGNRQQSRFLALVGNYDEYARALKIAENAEDTGAIQALKTMDSLSSKWEQVKVSIQEFYTSSGLEEIFKVALDLLNNFLTRLNDLTKIGGKLPFAQFAMLFSGIRNGKGAFLNLLGGNSAKNKGNKKTSTFVQTTEQTEEQNVTNRNRPLTNIRNERNRRITPIAQEQVEETSEQKRAALEAKRAAAEQKRVALEAKKAEAEQNLISKKNIRDEAQEKLNKATAALEERKALKQPNTRMVAKAVKDVKDAEVNLEKQKNKQKMLQDIQNDKEIQKIKKRYDQAKTEEKKQQAALDFKAALKEKKYAELSPEEYEQQLARSPEKIAKAEERLRESKENLNKIQQVNVVNIDDLVKDQTEAQKNLEQAESEVSSAESEVNTISKEIDGLDESIKNQTDATEEDTKVQEDNIDMQEDENKRAKEKEEAEKGVKPKDKLQEAIDLEEQAKEIEEEEPAIAAKLREQAEKALSEAVTEEENNSDESEQNKEPASQSETPQKREETPPETIPTREEPTQETEQPEERQKESPSEEEEEEPKKKFLGDVKDNLQDLPGIISGKLKEAVSDPQVWGAAADMASAAALAMIPDKADAPVQTAELVSGTLDAASAVAKFVSGDYVGALMSGISSVTKIVDGLFVSLDEKIEMLSAEAEAKKNEALKAKNEANSFENDLDSLEELESHRYDSAEAAAEYQAASERLAETYPQLIDGFDAMGNVIIDTTSAEELLAEMRRNSAAAALEAAEAEYELAAAEKDKASGRVAEIIENISQGYYNSSEYASGITSEEDPKDIFQLLGIDDLPGYVNSLDILNSKGLLEKLLPSGIELNEILNNGSVDISKVREAFDSDSKLAEFILRTLGVPEEEAIWGTVDFLEAKESDLNFEEERIASIESIQAELADLPNKTTEEIFALFDIIEAHNERFKDGVFSSLLGDNGLITDFREAVSEEERRSILLQKSSQRSIASELAAMTDSSMNAYDYMSESTGLFNESVKSITRNYEGALADRPALKPGEYIDEQAEAIEAHNNALEAFWEGLTEEQQAAFNELMENQDSYNAAQFGDKLQDFGLDTDDPIYAMLMEGFNLEYREAKNNWYNSIVKINEKNRTSEQGSFTLDAELQNFGDNLSEEMMSYVRQKFEYVSEQVRAGLISVNEGQATWTAYSEIFSMINDIEDEALRGQALEAYKNFDFTLEGTFGFLKELSDLGIDTSSIAGQVEIIRENINVNINSSVENFISNISAAFAEMAEMIDKANEGMSLEEASKLAEKIPELKLSDFEIRDGKFFLNNAQMIMDYYQGYYDELYTALEAESQEQLDALHKEWLELDQKQTKGLLDEKGRARMAEIEAQEDAIEESTADAKAAYEDYAKQMVNIDLIQAGYINDFFTNVGISEEEGVALKQAFASGNFEAIKTDERLKSYGAALINMYNNVGQKTYESIISSLDSEEFFEITDANRDLITSLESKGLVEVVGNYARGVVGQRDALIQAIFEDDSLDLIDQNAMAQSLLGQVEHYDISGALASMIEDPLNISLDTLVELANGTKSDLTTIISAFTSGQNADGTYTSSLAQIIQNYEAFGITVTAEIQDAINKYLQGIISIVSSGIGGSMTFEELEQLESFLGLDIAFTQTAEGLKLTKDSAIEVYTELKKIDSIQAQITFSDLAESLEEAGSGYEDIASTMATIAKLNKELANVPVSSERRAELERELAVAEEILRVRSQDPDSFNFMDKELPTGMQGPENYWNSVGEAYKVMNESAKSGYMEIQDYVNLITHMSQMVEAAGGEFSIQGRNAAELIEMGMSALSNVDGEGVKINLENLGIDILGGTEGMTEGFDDAIKEMARGQIKMLDAAIQMLETIVAMEELGDIDTNSDNQIELGEIFKLDENDKVIGFAEEYAESLVNVRNALVEAGIDLNQVTIGTHTLNDLLTTSYSEWKTFGITAEQQQQLINGLYQAVLSDDWDPNNISSIFSTWAQTIGESFAMNNEQVSIKVSDTGEIFAINWEDPNLEEKIETAGLESKEQAQELVKKYINSASDETIEITSDDLYKIHILSGEITVTKDENGETYYYNGQEYKDLNELKAILYAEEQTGHIGGEIIELPDGTIGVKQTIKVGNNEVTVVTSDGGKPEYTTDNGGKGATLEEAIANEYRANGIRSNGVLIESQEDYEYRVGYRVKPVVTFPETFDTSDPTTRSSVTEFLSKGTAGIEQAITEAQDNGDGTKTITIGDNLTFTVAEGATAAEIEAQIMQEMGIDQLQFESLTTAITTAITNAFSGEAGKAIKDAISEGLATTLDGEQNVDGIPIGEITLKPTGLKIDTTDIEPTLGDNLAGTAEAPIDIGDIGVVSGTASELKITSIPSEGTYSPEGEGATGKITITGGISNAEGEISTITLIPVAGATSSVSGDIPVADVATVTINGTTYTVDVSQGTQTNTTMSLTGVKAGSAAVEATSYTVTFTNANGTTQTVTVQGQAQLTAVLTGAVQEGGIWKIPNVAAEADVSISEASKNSITTFFETLIDKLKNIEVSVTPAEKPVAANPQTPGSYNASVNLTNGGTQNFSNESYDGLISAIQGLINTGTANEGTYTIEKVDANGAVIESTTVTVDSNSATVTGQETKTPSDGGTKSTPVAPTTPKTGGEEAPALDTSVLVAEFQAIGAAAISAAANISTATTSLTSIDTSPITTAASRVWSLISAMNGITADAANRVKNLASAMNSIPSGTKSLTLNVTVSASGAGSGKVTGNYKILKSGNVALAKGTGSALTKGTLMGELGPELVVADGRYFTVGNDGAEFVDLPDDAIVFNHLQTQKLLGSSGGMVGTGKPVTNEKKATSLATGNISGPAMASASAALAQLRQIRAMWQSMLNASAKDLGSLAGAGGGGGGGGGGGDEVAAVLGDLDRWYNLLRQIDSLEQHITLEQAKRANMRSGYDIVKSMEKELDMLKKQKAAYEELAKRQKEYYDLRRQDLLNSDYSQIFTYDEHGLMQYVEEKGKGLDILAALNATDANGKAKMNAKQQLAYLQKIGFDTSVLTTNADGTKAKKPEDQMQNFWDGIDGWMEEMDSLYDSYHDAATSAEEAAEAMAEILQEYIDNQLEVEQKLMQAIEDREQAEIDRIQDEKDALEEASQAYIDGLNDALSKEKDMYSKNKDAEETARLQRRLAILQRSGGSTSEIKSLQEQIDSRMQDEYFNKMQDQIDAIQEASDNQLEKLQNQIDIMTEALEYQKENGLLWQEVYSMMAEWTPEQMLAFIEQYTQSYQQNSQTQNEQDSQETQQQLEMQAAYQARQAYDAYASSSAVTDTYGAETVEAAGEDAKNAYIDAIANGGTQQEAEAAANAVFGSHSAADRDVAEINSLVGDLGLNDKLKAAYLKSYNETEGTEEEKQLAGKKAMVSLLKKSDYGEDPGVTTASLSAASTLYSTKVMRDENGDVIGPKAQRRAIKKGKSVKIYGATMDSTGKADRKAFLVNYGGKTGYIYAANVANGEDIHKKYKTYEAIKNLPSYSSGGDIDFTGLAMVHGSKNHPENILSAEHTELLKQGIFSNSNHSLAATVAAIQELAKEMASSGIANSGEQIIIQQAVVNIEPGVIANDYDAKRAGEMALEEMIKIARKSGNRTISR